jgi:hypothetical protein
MAGINVSPESFTPQYRQLKAVRELTDRFNRGDLDYLPRKDLENVAMLAAQFGTDLTPKSKPVRKALFDFVDSATLGLVPNKWRPTSIGEEYFGESSTDKTWGNIGTAAGFAVPFKYGIAAVKGANTLWKTRKGAQAGNKMSDINKGRDTLLLGSGAPRLGPPAPRLPLPREGSPNLLQLGMGSRAVIDRSGRAGAYYYPSIDDLPYSQEFLRSTF